MGTLFVDKLDPQSGTSLEIGSSGDTITIPSGATIANSGTSTGFGGTNTSRWFVKRTGSQSLSNNSYVKVQLNTEVIDSENNFDSSTNYRYTITEAGTYMLGAQMYLSAGANSNLFNGNISIRKNGSDILTHSYNWSSNDPYEYTPNITCIHDFVATDYLEVYAKVEARNGSGSAIYDTGDGSESNFFWGYKLIT
tara:strand:+ start:222 stop:806 length:585 start_codon:yes stop_codon:yes gene_type:complete